MARPRIGPLAPLGRPRAALRRLDPRARGRRAHPLPGRRAAPRGRGALPPANDPPGRGREPPPGAAADPRAAARRARIAPPPGRGAHRAAGPRGRGGRRGARHDRGRPQPHPRGAARGLRTQRPGPPAGPLGASHGHPFRRGQRRAVVAASGALRPPLAQPAGRGGGVDVRRGSGLPGERRAGRGDVHAAADGAGHLVGVRRPQRAGHRGLRHAALESGMAPRRGIPPLGGGRGGDPRLGRAPRAETPHRPAVDRRAGRLPRRQRRRDACHGTPRGPRLRAHTPRGHRRHPRGAPARGRRGRLRRAVAPPAAAAPGLAAAPRGRTLGRGARHALPHGRRMARRGRRAKPHGPRRRPHLPPFRPRHGGRMVRRAEKSVHLPS